MSAGRLPNNDAHSLVFDDTNLFDTSKFSGWDRVEGGVRANIGAQYTFLANNGASISALFGESFHLAGTNSYSSPTEALLARRRLRQLAAADRRRLRPRHRAVGLRRPPEHR